MGGVGQVKGWVGVEMGGRLIRWCCDRLAWCGLVL